ncbi:MAG TPA: hypothetical protein VJB57_18400 [Dehalococcoidia bacterium]|nr:hypothetical protein [Dehalococcoidia bacterium]
MYDFRTGNDTRGPVKDPLQWQSTLALVSYRGACLEGIKLIPLDLGLSSGKRSHRGRPVLAHGEVAADVLGRLKEYSEPFGTKIVIDGEIGVIRP